MNETDEITQITTETAEPAADASTAPRGAASPGPGLDRLDKRYVKLVRLAYLVLPATGRRSYRLAIAQRIVDASLPRRAWSDRAAGDRAGARTAGRAITGAYAPIRGQVLRQAMNPSPWLRIGLGSRLRRLPKPGPATPARLAALDPAVRAAYVLRRVESLPRSIVREQLVQIGVPAPTDVVRAADQVPELSLPRVTPGPPLPRRSRIPLGVAGAVTIAALVAAQAGPQHHRAATAPSAPAPAPTPAAGSAAGLAAGPAAGPVTRPAANTGHSPADAGHSPRAAAEVFWTGRLPGGVPARWICRRVVAAGGPAKSVGILLAGGLRRRTGCGHAHGTTVGGTWWRTPGARGRWYFVAAADRRFLVKVVPPPSFPYHVPGARRGVVFVPGPRGGARPPHGRMTVTADRM
jgi:hypothetical protein